MRSPVLIALAAATALSVPALAQETDDWDASRDGSGAAITARVEYAAGISVFLQCQSGTLLVGYSGTASEILKASESVVTRANEPPFETAWDETRDPSTVVVESTRLARLMYRGGQVSISYLDEGETVRIDLHLPARGAAAAAVLSACNADLENDRDLEPSANRYLEAVPRIEFPLRYMPRTRTEQLVEVSCIVRQGRLSACRSEREYPAHPDAGAAVAANAERRRVRVSDAAGAEGGVVDVSITAYP